MSNAPCPTQGQRNESNESTRAPAKRSLSVIREGSAASLSQVHGGAVPLRQPPISDRVRLLDTANGSAESTRKHRRHGVQCSHRQRTPTKSRGGKPRFLLHVNPIFNPFFGGRIGVGSRKGDRASVRFS